MRVVVTVCVVVQEDPGVIGPTFLRRKSLTRKENLKSFELDLTSFSIYNNIFNFYVPGMFALGGSLGKRDWE